MEDWKRTITEGNQAFQLGDNVQAITCYQTASNKARKYLDEWFDTESALSALIVTDLNLAESQCRLARFQDAIETYAALNLELRRFQCRFAPGNPIVGQVSQALTRIKKEFLWLTQTYAYDILTASKKASAEQYTLD